jgi:acid stress-induced BolA-like protein IbaG/YrbA
MAGIHAPDTIHPMTAEQVAELIRSGLPNATVRILTDDDTHFEALVVATQFVGKRSIARHQLVYAALGPRMGREIHALSIKAFTPEEWAATQGREAQ